MSSSWSIFCTLWRLGELSITTGGRVRQVTSSAPLEALAAVAASSAAAAAAASVSAAAAAETRPPSDAPTGATRSTQRPPRRQSPTRRGKSPSRALPPLKLPAAAVPPSAVAAAAAAPPRLPQPSFATDSSSHTAPPQTIHHSAGGAWAKGRPPLLQSEADSNLSDSGASEKRGAADVSGRASAIQRVDRPADNSATARPAHTAAAHVASISASTTAQSAATAIEGQQQPKAPPEELSTAAAASHANNGANAENAVHAAALSAESSQANGLAPNKNVTVKEGDTSAVSSHPSKVDETRNAGSLSPNCNDSAAEPAAVSEHDAVSAVAVPSGHVNRKALSSEDLADCGASTELPRCHSGTRLGPELNPDDPQVMPSCHIISAPHNRPRFGSGHVLCSYNHSRATMCLASAIYYCYYCCRASCSRSRLRRLQRLAAYHKQPETLLAADSVERMK